MIVPQYNNRDLMMITMIKTKAVKRRCTWCNKLAHKQTVRGKENEISGGLSQNDGYFCNQCWKKGEDEEREAIYGECRYNCKC